MIFHTVYYLWILFPLWFLVYGIWVLLKRISGRGVREYPSEYFIPFLFTAGALIVAIWLDQTIYEELVEALTLGFVDVMIARWLLYPAILLLLAYGSGFLNRNKKSDRYLPDRRQRIR